MRFVAGSPITNTTATMQVISDDMLALLQTLRDKGGKIGFVSASDMRVLAHRLAPKSHGKDGTYFRAVMNDPCD